LSKQNLSVALLDAGLILNGTTGHTTAKVTAQHGLIYDEFIQHFGVDKTKLYYEANIEAKKFIEQTINTSNIECDFKNENAVLYKNYDNYLKKMEAEQKANEKLKIIIELLIVIILS